MHRPMLGIMLAAFGCHSIAACESVPLSTDALMIAEVRLDDRSARLALDPIRNVLLDQGFAEASGVEVLDARQVGYEGRVSIGGAGSEEQEPGFAVGLELEAGPVSRKLDPVVVLDLRGPLGPSFQSIDGLLGTDLFSGHVLDIDAPGGCLRLVPRGRFQPPKQQPLRVERKRHRPVVSGSIEFPGGERHELALLLDFGMAGTIRISTRYVDEHRLHERLATTVPEHMETGLGGELQSLEARADRVELGGTAWRDLRVRLAREREGADVDPPWDALIGVGLLKTRRLLYDAAGDRIWIL